MALALAFLGFLLITALVMSAYYTLTTESPIAERLRAVGAAQTSDGRRKQAEAPGFVWLSNLLAGIGKFGFGGDEKSLSNMLSVAGYRGPNATVLFLGVRTIVSFGPAILLIITQIAAGKPLSTALLSACEHEMHLCLPLAGIRPGRAVGSYHRVIPAKAGISVCGPPSKTKMPAFAGMTLQTVEPRRPLTPPARRGPAA
jgi:hypothetical protein